MLKVLQAPTTARSSTQMRKMDDVVDELYTAVKLYLTQISREALDEKDGRRWADIMLASRSTSSRSATSSSAC